MKRTFIKTGAAVLCAALALTIYGNASDVLAYDGEVPYEEFGIDPSTVSERDDFYNYQEYAVYAKLPEAVGSNPSPAVREIAAEAERAVYSVWYDRNRPLEELKGEIADIMDYYLERIEEQKIAENTVFKPYDSSLTLEENGIDFIEIMRYYQTVTGEPDACDDRTRFEAERDARSYYFEWLIQQGAASSAEDIEAVMAATRAMREWEYNDSLSYYQNVSRVYTASRNLERQYFSSWDGM